MIMSESLHALRRANPRATPRFDNSVAAVADVVRARVEASAREPVANRPARRFRTAPLAAAVAAGAAVAAYLVAGLPTGGPSLENAAAAVKRAATVSAASADLSGTAVVRITHNGDVWGARTIRWHGGDLSVTSDDPDRRRKGGSPMLLVDGTMYGIADEDGFWVVLGRPESIDPGSGTTPGEYLTAVREDVGGATLERITGGMRGLTAAARDDGSTVYGGTVAAGLIARETGVKQGRAIRMLPFGYVAHDEAADPAARLDAAVTVGANGVVREITVRWGTSASRWVYTVAYERLGETPAPTAPADAKNPLKERLGEN
jgi:hypothetical protein